jgi:hypothetical protein
MGEWQELHAAGTNRDLAPPAVCLCRFEPSLDAGNTVSDGHDRIERFLPERDHERGTRQFDLRSQTAPAGVC